jgi:hypothetical protein
MTVSQLSGNKGEQGGIVSSEVFERGDSQLDRRSTATEPSDSIGIGLAAAFALIAIYCAGTWAVVVLVQALT